jgi:hypothetical protein
MGKKALVLNSDWQQIEKSLREELGYAPVWIKDDKEGALEWCRTHPVDLIVGSYHMGIIELSGSLAEHSSVSGSAFKTQNPKILLTWHPDFSEDRLEGPDVVPDLDENGEYEHGPHPNIAASGIETFKKPLIASNFAASIRTLVSGSNS